MNIKDRNEELYQENVMKATRALSSLKDELKRLKQEPSNNRFEVNAFKSKYEFLYKELSIIKEQRNEIANTTIERTHQTYDIETERLLFQDLFDTEDQINETAKRLIKAGQECLEKADSINKTLKEDDERVDRMIENIDIIEDNTIRAKRELSGIIKGLLADKLVLICLILTILGFSAVILFKILDMAGVFKKK